jgi:cyclase
MFASSLAAQVRTADPIKRGLQLTDFPRFVKLADNVYGYEEIRQPGFTTVSLVVVGRNGVLIADGQGNAAATQKMLDMIKTLTPLPVKWYVVGSEHGDHTGGNSVLPKDITMIENPNARRRMMLDSTLRNSPPMQPGESGRRVNVPPIAQPGDEQTIDVGGIVVKAVYLGRAHTGYDMNVYLPRERILFMSEVFLNRVFPAMRSAFPNEWVQTVDRALAMDVTRFVPGHGFIEEPAVSREELGEFRKALVYVIGEVERLHDLKLSAADALSKANWGPYADWFIREQQAPIAIRKVYEQIEGKLP